MTPTGGKRGSSFFRRVVAEREALRVVNSAVQSSLPLQGITPQALDVWQKANADHVTEQLAFALGVLCQLLGRAADQSRAVFDFGPETGADLTKALDDIRSALAR